MKIPVVHVDAFTSQAFRGNPAAVCPLESWLDDQTLQSIGFLHPMVEHMSELGWGVYSFDQEGGRFIYFEGTYTGTFSRKEDFTPRYDYNQIMYRLDLSDPRLSLSEARPGGL